VTLEYKQFQGSKVPISSTDSNRFQREAVSAAPVMLTLGLIPQSISAPFAVCVGHAHSNVHPLARFERDRQNSRVYRGSMDLLVRRRMLVAAGRMRERESNASLAPRVGSDARLESWEHSARGQGLSQWSNAGRVRKAASELRSAFPMEYRRAVFGVDDPFTRRKCSVEGGPLRFRKVVPHIGGHTLEATYCRPHVGGQQATTHTWLSPKCACQRAIFELRHSHTYGSCQ